MSSIRDIVDKCLRMRINPRIVNFDEVIEDDGRFYKILMTRQKGIEDDVFINSMDHGLYIDGIFDLGLELSDFSNVKCTLYRFVREVPLELLSSKFTGRYGRTGCEFKLQGGDVELHLDSLDAFVKGDVVENDVGSYLRVPSPYGEYIEVEGYSIDTGFQASDEPPIETAYCLSKNSFLDSDVTPDEYRKMRDRSVKKIPMRGDIWMVRNLEFGENGERNHGCKDHPIIVLDVHGRNVKYYTCTSNDTVYKMPKYCLRNMNEKGFKKDKTYFELREKQIEKDKLSYLMGILSKEDLRFVLNPPEYQYWKYEHKKVPCGD